MIKKLISILVLISVLLTLSTNVFATEPKTYEYYGIVDGNGQKSNIYLKVNDNWEYYTIESDYIGYECKLIVIDKVLTKDNYKDILIINIKEIQDIPQANECINNWNQSIK